MYLTLTDNKTGAAALVNMAQVERVEPRSRGAALYYTAYRRPVRVAESMTEIGKRLGVKKASPRGRGRR